MALGCEHYSRNCSIVAPCCDGIYSCRVCHDDDDDNGHVLNRKMIEKVRCNSCRTIQSVAEQCAICGLKFGEYFCRICNLFDNEDKNQFHCFGCGICRVGGRDNFFHCVECEICLSLDLKDNHNCVKKTNNLVCSKCQEDIYASRKPVKFPKCGHLIHEECFDFVNRRRKSCPKCRRSLCL